MAITTFNTANLLKLSTSMLAAFLSSATPPPSAVAVSGLVLAISGQPVSANTEITIDRRVRSEDRNYALTFAAKPRGPDSTFGHAFIVWQKEEDAKQMSIADAVGFHVVDEKSNKLERVFGVPGNLKSDLEATPVVKLTVLVNSDVYQRALTRKNEWQQEKKDSEYYGFWNNCVGHVAAIAQAIGLDTSTGSWVTPVDYVQDLMSRNRSLDPGQKEVSNPPPAPTPVAQPPKPAPMASPPAPRPAPRPRRQIGPSFWDRGWDNGAGGGGGGGGGWSGTMRGGW